jgi:putative acetyltransferase
MQHSQKDALKSCIRQFQADDARKVRNLVKSVFEEFNFELDCAGDDADIEEISSYYKSPSSTFLVLEVDGEFAGTVGVKRHSQNQAELRRMYLKPDMRGKGFGKELLATALEFSMSRKYESIFLQTSEKFGRAIRLYESFGFRQTGRCGDRCELTYEKTLKARIL